MIILNDDQPRGLGYFEVDHRKAHSELPPGTNSHFEADTYTCSHCQFVVIMNPDRKRERYKCSGCNHHVCDGCAAKRVAGEACKTYAEYVEERLEQALRQPETSPLIKP